MPDVFDSLFDTDGFPARWHCGNWTDALGWLHICSDIAIFSAYMCIPAVLTYFVIRRDNVPFAPIFWWFGAFIAFCGVGHLLEAVIFWMPVYRLAGLNKLCTAVVSWGTLLAMIPAARGAMRWRSPDELEAEIARQTALYRDLYDNAADMYVSVHAETGTISQCNETALKRLGYASDELLGKSFLDLYDPSSRRDAQAALEGLAAAGRIDNAELVVRTKSGKRIDVSMNMTAVRDEAGHITFSRAAWRDISEKKHAEALFELAVEASPNAMVVASSKGRIVLVNAACETMFGYGRDELVGQPLGMIVPTPPEGDGGSLTARRKKGSSFPVQVGINPVETATGTLVLAAVVDLTELVSKQRELERSNAELEQFAYVASHDLQEPLRMISSYVALLEKRYKGQLDERADKYIGYAVDGASRMQAMLRDVLQMSRVGSDAHPFEDVPLDRVLEEASKALALDRSDATLTVDALPTVQGDRVQLARVFQNLLSNAVKFSGDAPARIEVSARETSQGWEVRVRDHGIGFEQQHAGRIFEVFQRLHGRGEFGGTGVGLAIVHKIVQRHGGRVWAEGREGQGATFFFTLPRGVGES